MTDVPSFDSIKLEIADTVATITLNRPDRLNSMPPAMADDIRAALDHLPGLGARARPVCGSLGSLACGTACVDGAAGVTVAAVAGNDAGVAGSATGAVSCGGAGSRGHAPNATATNAMAMAPGSFIRRSPTRSWSASRCRG